MTDVFKSKKSTLLALSTADEAHIKFKRASTTYFLAALDINVKYTADFKFMRVPGNNIVALSNGALGSISIAALLGKDADGIVNFVEHFGNICNVNNADPLKIELDSGMKCDGLNLDTHGSALLDCYQVHLVGYNPRLIKNVLVAVNLQLRFAHLETTIPTTPGGI